MSKVQMLRVCVEQRLSAAAEEILVLFERMISEYEEELCRSKEENQRHRKLLDAVFKPQLQIHRAERSADVQQLLESKGEVPPEQQERSSSLDQEEPEPPHIKEEQEELWTSQEGEQLQGLEEADITTFTPVSVKSEDDEEKPQSSQLHHRQTEQMETEADGGSEPASNVDPDSHLKPVTHVKPLESEADNRDDWKEISELQVGVNFLGSDDESDMQCNTDKESFSCSECGRTFCRRDHLMSHMRTHTGEKPFSCNMAVRRKYDVNFKERVLQYAEENSGKKTAQHFDIDPKRIRYWQKQKSELLLADKQRARLTGGGRKKVSAELERLLLDWIYTMREKNIRVTTKMIKNKALEIYPSVSDAGQVFVASRSWLQRFLQRNNLSLRCTASLPRPPLL